MIIKKVHKIADWLINWLIISDLNYSEQKIIMHFCMVLLLAMYDMRDHTI